MIVPAEQGVPLKTDMGKATEAYLLAVKTLSKVASKGTTPKARASHKISCLTILEKKHLTDARPIKTRTSKASTTVLEKK